MYDFMKVRISNQMYVMHIFIDLYNTLYVLLKDLFEINALGKPIVKKTLEREKVGKDGSLFKNFNKKPVVPSKRFAEGRRQILSFQELRESLRFAIYQKRFSR